MVKEKPLSRQLAIRMIEYFREAGLPAGTHLGAQGMADRFHVSRIPITETLKILASQGLVYGERNRGFFLAQDGQHLPPPEAMDDETAPWDDPLYYQLAEDWLSGKLAERVSENELMRQYDATRSRLKTVLARASDDLWVERLPGHGWRFQAVMVSAQSYADGYRVRMTIEPAALLEPGFKVDRAVLAGLAEQQIALLKGGMRTRSRNDLFAINTEFHETLVSFSNNPFYLDALKKLDRLRRLLDFRSTVNRDRLIRQCSEHLEIIDLLERGDVPEAAEMLRNHLKGALESKLALVAQGQDAAPAGRHP